ncbi:MAG TPA: hypothetical protein VEQ66_17255 [Propionibacteriaceae bacterium]|nr:hypothetical protein [Propionibacteriaceae bacterium]
MTRRAPRSSAWLMVGALVVLTACSPIFDGDRKPDSPSSPPTPSRSLSVRNDLIDPQVIPWRSWRVVGGATLEFTVTAGDSRCYGAETKVVETETAVRVRLRVGWLPEAKERDCDAIALESVVVVPLAKALGKRKVEPLS